MPDAETRLSFRRTAAALNGAYAAFQLLTAVVFMVTFGGMGALVLALGIAEGEVAPQIFGGGFAGLGILLGLLVVAMMVVPHVIAAVALWSPGGVWREIVSAVLVLGAFTQFPHGTIVAFATLAVAVIELIARSQAKPQPDPA